MGFRDFYDKDLNFFINKYRDYYDREYLIIKYAKRDLRMYANLYNRDMKRKLLREDSVCNYCKSNENLTIDHIKPISKGGKNVLDNIQILCNPCNNKKRDQ